jgi:type IV pilus assembly protein PilA
MLTRIRKAMDEREGGFTLIELLVVIIIIGILAAIAIPVFLNQRKKGYDSQAKSDLRNAATIQETYLTDKGEYGSETEIAGAGYDFKSSANTSNFTVVYGDGETDGYCMTVDSDSGKSWQYDSRVSDGVTEGTCA